MLVDAHGNEPVVGTALVQVIYDNLISNVYAKRGALTDKYYVDKVDENITVAEKTRIAPPLLCGFLMRFMSLRQKILKLIMWRCIWSRKNCGDA